MKKKILRGYYQKKIIHLVACNDWSKLVDSQTCLKDGLIINEWSTEEDLVNKTSEDLKTEMIYTLFDKIDYKVHDIMDLGVR